MSTLKADTIQNTSGGAVTLTKQSAAKAWAYLESGTATILDSVNVASTTDNGTGDHTVTYSNALANDDYSVGGSAQTARRYFSGYSSATKLTSSVRYVIYVDNGTINDADSSVQIHGDLA
jgi:hypothetical protein